MYIRSVYSLLSSMCTIDGIVSYGKKYGYTHLGLVDRNVLAGAMSFKKACEKAGIHPVYGLEFEIRIEDRTYVTVLYARNDAGFENLMKLSSHICTREDKIIDLNILNEYRGDCILVLLSDDMPLTYAADRDMDMQETLNRQRELFKDYTVGLMDHDIAINANRDRKIKELLKKNRIPMIALNRTYYLERDDYEDYEILKCIRDKRIYDNNTAILESGRYLLSRQEYDALYEQDELINTDQFAQNCQVEMDFETSLPLYENKKNIPSKDYLVALCNEGLKRRLKNDVPDVYKKRLDYELSVILKMHFEDYFLIVYDFILYAKKQSILVGPGRGSAAGSLVSYCLGITDIDPLKYGLLFERFLNPERISMPDIDTDFPDDRRDEVIRYVRDRYGIEHVGHIITYGTLKAKQVLRDVGRVLDYPVREIDGICKLIPNVVNMDLEKAYATLPLFKQKIESEQRYRRLYKIARKLEFFPRHESTHAAGIVMSRKPLEEVVPVIRIEDDIYSTQYTMEHLEELGLIKMDFLGLRNLGIIAEITQDIQKDEPSFSLKDIPLDDPKTFKLIQDVNVSGVFQLESSGMRNLIRKMKPVSFEEIAVAIALFRPGPMKNIPAFLENRSHPESVSYLHPNLKPILEETYGIIVYQEQIINIARVMAGFTYGKADILRKAMSKKKLSELEKLYPDFIDGCLKKGYDRQLAEKVYELILEFANYGFGKAHSIAYAMVAYQLAYLKANYPLYFYKALLNGVIGSQSKTYDYITECLNIKQKVKGVSLNESALTYQIKDEAIVMPFGICKDVGAISATKVLEERENGLFKDYIDAVKRLTLKGVERNVLENLIYAGAFDSFGYSRHTMISALSNVIMYANAHRGEESLMDDFDDTPIIEQLKDDNMVLAENEKNVLGFYFSFNPIADVKKKNSIDTLDLYQLSGTMGMAKGFGLIKRVKSLRTKKGDMMAFVDLVDDKGELSLAVMPNLYAQYGSQLVKGKYVYFEGRIEKEASCLVRNMRIL